MGTPAVAEEAEGITEKCVAVDAPVPTYVALMVRAIVPEFRISGLLEDDTPLTVAEENTYVVPPLMTGLAKLTEHEACGLKARVAGVVYVPGAQPVPAVVNEAPD
jgi:hypothetical protein